MNSGNGYCYKSIEKFGNTFLVITTLGIGTLQNALNDGFIPVDPVSWLPIELVFDDTDCDLAEAFDNGDIDLIKGV